MSKNQPKRFNPEKDAHSIANYNCLGCANADLRKTDQEGLCTVVKSVCDGLPVRCVGSWANQKIYYLIEYFKLFTGGMKNKWGRLRYVEICSGPGRCILREDRKEQDGTALCVLNSELFQHISSAVFVDSSQVVVDTLNARIESAGKNAIAKAIVGDYNNPQSMVASLKSSSADELTLCFIDPTDCSLPFYTILEIKRAIPKCDFIISVFDGLDFHRNASMIINRGAYPNLRQKYLRFLGVDDFFERPEVVDAAKRPNNDLSTLFRDCYSGQLKSIGLIYQGSKEVKNYYYLQFASENSRGLDFWEKASAIAYNGQMLLGL